MAINKKRSFTIIEIMVVVTIVGMIAAFGIPNYFRTIERGYLTDAMEQLRIIHAAQQIYFINHDAYYPFNIAPQQNLPNINNALNINIIHNGFDYACFDTGVATHFFCRAYRNTEANPFFIVDVDQTALVPGANPVCFPGSRACP